VKLVDGTRLPFFMPFFCAQKGDVRIDQNGSQSDDHCREGMSGNEFQGDQWKRLRVLVD
jgi:hypothetical protein